MWSCPDADCPAKTWTEQSLLVAPRRVLTTRAAEWAASNGPVEAANLYIKQVKRSGRGFRNHANYRLRILLAGGTNPLRETQQVTSIRPRRPRMVA